MSRVCFCAAVLACLLCCSRVSADESGCFFSAPVYYQVGQEPCSVALADLDGDADLDLAVADQQSGNVSVLLGNGDGTFLPRVDYPSGSGAFSVTAALLDEDGARDLAVANSWGNSMSVMLGHGDGTFGPPTIYPGGDAPYAVAAACLNADPLEDLVVAVFDEDCVRVFLGTGGGSFAPGVRYDAGNGPEAIACADIDHDGDVDIVVADRLGDAVSVLRGRGDGSFAQPESYPAGDGAYSVAVADFDGDGNSDLAVAGYYGNVLSVLLGSTDGTFGPREEYGVGTYPCSVVATDLNGDECQDLAVANYVSGDVSVLLGDGQGRFYQGGTYAGGGGPWCLASGDLDGDGDADLVAANRSTAKVAVLLNSPSGMPAPPTVTGVRDLRTGEHLRVEWLPSTTPRDGYRIFRRESSGVALELVGTASADATRYVDNSVVDGVSYCYVVRSTLGPCESVPSNQMTGTARHPVVLIHGFDCGAVIGGGVASMDSLRTWLVDPGGPGYPDGSVWVCDNLEPAGGVSANALLLSAYIESMKTASERVFGVRARTVDLVAHSMGGLVARCYMHGLVPRHAHQVRKVIMLGTPNAGSVLADAAYCLRLHQLMPLCSGFLDMTDPSIALFDLLWGDAQSGCGKQGPEYYVIGGTGFTVLGADGDGVVRLSEAMGIQACGAFAADHVSHGDLVRNRGVFDSYILPILESQQLGRVRRCSYGSMLRSAHCNELMAVGGDSLAPAEGREFRLWVDAGVDTMVVTTLWFRGSFVLSCTAPSGAVIDSTYAQTHPEVSYSRHTPGFGPRIESLSIGNPEVGEWTAEVACESQPGDFLLFVEGGSSVVLEPVLPTSPIDVGSDVVLGLQLTDAGSPVADATCAIRIQQPGSGLIDSLSLFDDGVHGDGASGDGVYANHYVIPGPVGSYLIRMDACGEGAMSGVFDRIQPASLVVGDHVPPIVDVLYPDGGEELQAGRACTLSWRVSGCEETGSTEVLLSRDDGGSYPDTLARFAAAESLLVWWPPEEYSPLCRLAVIAHDAHGNCGSGVSDESWSVVPSTGVPGDAEDPLAFEPKLLQNVPNPFNPVTTISYEAPADAKGAHLVIYSVSGAIVRQWHWDSPSPGLHHVIWNSMDGRGRRVGSGVYFYRLEVDEWSDLKKMVILK